MKTTKNKYTKIKKVYSWIKKYIYSIVHCVTFICLTTYIILNWKLCISMQLFSQFNGNNILFIVWIILIFLMIYDVEAKGVKLEKHKIKEDFETAGKIYDLDMLYQNKNQPLNNNQRGEGNNGLSN